MRSVLYIAHHTHLSLSRTLSLPYLSTYYRRKSLWLYQPMLAHPLSPEPHSFHVLCSVVLVIDNSPQALQCNRLVHPFSPSVQSIIIWLIDLIFTYQFLFSRFSSSPLLLYLTLSPLWSLSYIPQILRLRSTTHLLYHYSILYALQLVLSSRNIDALAAFQMFDTNGNGSIDRANLLAGIQVRASFLTYSIPLLILSPHLFIPMTISPPHFLFVSL